MTKKQLEKEIQNITQQIIERYKPEKIILFGSAVRGDFDEDSDVDFLIIKKDTPYYGRDRIKELRKLVEKKIPADFLIYKPEEVNERLSLKDPFILSIVTEGRVLYG